MASYRLRIDKIFIDNVRAKDTDTDELLIFASVGNLNLDPAIYFLGSGINSGTVLDGREDLPDPTFISGWGIDIPDVADTDLVTITVHVNNVKHDGTKPIIEPLSDPVVRAFAAGAFAGYVTAQDEAIGAKVFPKMSLGPIPSGLMLAASVAVEDAVLGTVAYLGLSLFGKSKSDCFGPVFQQTFVLQGAAIRAQDRQIFTTPAWTEETPKDCGMSPHAHPIYLAVDRAGCPRLRRQSDGKSLRPVPRADVPGWFGEFADVAQAGFARVKVTISPPSSVERAPFLNEAKGWLRTEKSGEASCQRSSPP